MTLALAVAVECHCRPFYEVSSAVVCYTVLGVSRYLQAGWRKAVGQKTGGTFLDASFRMYCEISISGLKWPGRSAHPRILYLCPWLSARGRPNVPDLATIYRPPFLTWPLYTGHHSWPVHPLPATVGYNTLQQPDCRDHADH